MPSGFPAEMMYSIFSKLEMPTLCQMRTVNTEWKKISDDLIMRRKEAIWWLLAPNYVDASIKDYLNAYKNVDIDSERVTKLKADIESMALGVVSDIVKKMQVCCSKMADSDGKSLSLAKLLHELLQLDDIVTAIENAFITANRQLQSKEILDTVAKINAPLSEKKKIEHTLSLWAYCPESPGIDHLHTLIKGYLIVCEKGYRNMNSVLTDALKDRIHYAVSTRVSTLLKLMTVKAAMSNNMDAQNDAINLIDQTAAMILESVAKANKDLSEPEKIRPNLSNVILDVPNHKGINALNFKYWLIDRVTFNTDLYSSHQFDVEDATLTHITFGPESMYSLEVLSAANHYCADLFFENVEGHMGLFNHVADGVRWNTPLNEEVQRQFLRLFKEIRSLNKENETLKKENDLLRNSKPASMIDDSLSHPDGPEYKKMKMN